MVLYLRQMPGSTRGLGFDVPWFYFLFFQIAVKAQSLDTIVALLSGTAVCIHEIDRLYFAVSDQSIDDTFGEFEFVGDLFDRQPFVFGNPPGAIQHFEKAV